MGRKSNKEARRQEILENLYDVLLKEGLEGASIAKIANHMGISQGLLFHYFKTKEEMIIGLVDLIIEKYKKAYFLKFEAIKDPYQRFNTLLDEIFSLNFQKVVEHEIFYACFYLGFRNNKIRDRIKGMYSQFRELLIYELNMYVEKGIVRNIDPEKFSDLIISLVEGFGFYQNICNSKSSLEELGPHLKELTLRWLKEAEK
jgi:AcrR family transcriptional regulator